jgi:hypothetical protein
MAMETEVVSNVDLEDRRQARVVAKAPCSEEEAIQQPAEVFIQGTVVVVHTWEVAGTSVDVII